MGEVENSICLDTDILIELLRNKAEIVAWIKEHEENCHLATTIINIFELFYGVYLSNSPKIKMKEVNNLIERLTVLDISLKSANEAGKQLARLKKEGELIEFRDVLIGTTSLVEGFSLKTNNKTHFSRVEGLRLV